MRSLAQLSARLCTLPTREDTMLELQMEDSVSRGDSEDLVSALRRGGLSSTTLTRLHLLVTKDLSGPGFSRVLVVLKSLEILSQNKDDLQSLMEHGLTAKLVLWFEAVHDLLTSDLQRSSSLLLSLTEEFFEYFLLLGRASLPAPQLSAVLLQLFRAALEPQIHFPVRLEAIKTLNSVLDSLSREQRRQIQMDQNQNQILKQVAAAVLNVGDYELQVSLSEALCRLTPRKERQQRANQWFSSRDISGAFCDIRDADFEVDCRRFLNFVNRRHGDNRRVYTFPCLRAFLDSTELFRPKDENLDEFWIDFNVGSGCVSFFINEPQGFLWGSMHLLKEDVDRYSLQLRQDELVLSVHLNNPIMHLDSRGQTVELNFNSEHQEDLQEAAGRVFMKGRSSPRPPGGLVQVSPSADRQAGRSYSRKKPTSQLKVLPLSSPSSDEDVSVLKTPVSRAEFLFDQIRHSTPSETGLPVRAEPDASPVTQDVLRDRKRGAPDSGYLSDQTEGPLTLKRRAEPHPEGEESVSPLTESPEGAEPPEEQGEGLCEEEAGPSAEREGPVDEPGAGPGAGPESAPESALTAGITAAFCAFKTQLEQHFSNRQQDVQTQVLLSLRECQQQVSTLLTAVHQHRLQLLQSFHSSVSDQLTRLVLDSSALDSISSQILRVFRSEMQLQGSFCEEHLRRLSESGGRRVRPANQEARETSLSNQEEAAEKQ